MTGVRRVRTVTARRCIGVVATLALAAILALPSSASAQEAAFTNATPVTVPIFGKASPYASEISVAGMPGALVDLEVRLLGITHPAPDDLDILLVPPRGKAVPLMSDTCGSATFDDKSFEFNSRPPVGGNTWPYMGSFCQGDRFLPTNGPNNTDTSPDGWPDAPAGPYACCGLDHLHGADPNGVWRLYVVDDGATLFSSGAIARGWSLRITTGGADVLLPGAGTEGPAGRYPLARTATGQTGVITDLDVRLDFVGHTRPDDLDLLLVGPGGQTAMLMSDACGGPDGFEHDWTWDDEAAAAMPDGGGCATGRWRPTDHEPGDALPAPAPTGPHGTSLSAFDLTDPNGEWRLYAFDDTAGETGWIRSALFFFPQFTTRPKATVAFGADAVTVPEGQTSTLTLTRTGPPELGAGSVRVTSAPGSATSPGDYTPLSTVIQFAAGERSKAVPVSVLADSEPEGAETFVLSLSEAAGDAVAAPSAAATVTIPAQGGTGGGGAGGGPGADRVAPETTILKAPKRRTRRRTARVRFSASEPGARFECKPDRRKFQPCASPRKLNRLRPGKHRFAVRAIDPAGNVDPTPAVRRWRIVR
jgi:subtilisin-like proprotein convertase family protein